MYKIFLVLAVSAVTMAGCKEKPGKGEPGANLLDARCGRCHPMGVKKAHTTKEEWDKTVTRMMGKGAVLNNDEKAELLDFLVKYYQPQ
jgi:cytochrome c5